MPRTAAALLILSQPIPSSCTRRERASTFLCNSLLKSNNGILFHGVSFLGLAQVVTSTITRIRRLHFNAVHKIRRGGKKLLADGVLVQVFAVR